MKNASAYEKKVRKLLKGMKRQQPEEPPGREEALAVLVESVLQADATTKQAGEALEAIRREFVDFNELRVSPPKDVVDCIGRSYPDGLTKAGMMTTALRNLFERTYNVSMDYMEQMTKRDLRRHLGELGLSPYAASCVVLRVFGGHAVPVDETLVEVLKMDGYVHPDSDLPDVQGFLERIVPHRNGLSVHEFFRAHVAKSAKALERKRKADAQEREKAEAKAKARKKAAARAKKAKKAPSKKTPKKAVRKAGGKRPSKIKTKTSSKTEKAKKPTSPKRKSATSKTARKKKVRKVAAGRSAKR